MLTNPQFAKAAHLKDDEKLQSCQLATYRDGKLATRASDLATVMATSLATNDLTALSEKVLSKSISNCQATFMATSELPSSKNQATSVIQNQNLATQTISKKAGSNQLIKLQKLIELIGDHLKANKHEIAEMLTDTLEHHSIEAALSTFQNLATQLQIEFSKLTRPQTENELLVKCADCSHFEPDNINAAAGIGKCLANTWKPSHKPPYPLVVRRCKSYQLKTNH